MFSLKTRITTFALGASRGMRQPALVKASLLNSAGEIVHRFESVYAPETACGRMRGLLGRAPPAAAEALWLRPCRSIHTIGMRYAIDVLFLDRRGTVLRARRDLPPGRLAFAPRGTASVLECGGGSIPPDAAPGWRVGVETSGSEFRDEKCMV